MSISTPSGELAAALVRFAWGQWAQMGISADTDQLSPWAQDPEALIVFTLEIGRRDPRLFDELLDWLVVNEALISVRRLRALSTAPQDRRLVDASLGWVAGHRPRARLRARAGEPPSHAPEPLFLLGAAPIVKPDPIFAAEGLLRPIVAPSAKSQPPDLRMAISFAFRLRRLLGVGVRAEVIRILATSPASPVAAQELTLGTGYASRNIREALSALQQAGVVSAVGAGGGQRYRVDRTAWATLLQTPASKLPTHRGWTSLLPALVIALRGLERTESAGATDYMAASAARDLLETLRRPLREAGLDVIERPGIERATADLLETLSRAVSSLGETLDLAMDADMPA